MKVRAVRYSLEGVSIEYLSLIENVETSDEHKSNLWLDVSEYNNLEELAPLARSFNLHPLALEDCFNVRQRPKIDDYGEILFVIARTVLCDDVKYSEGLQVGIFLGKEFVITVHREPMPELDHILEEMKKRDSALLGKQSSFLLYTMLDNLVDSLEKSVTKAEVMETEVGAEVLKDKPPDDVLRSIHTCRSNLLLVRQLLRPQSDGIEQLMSGNFKLVDQESRVFLRDVNDHTRRTLDRIDGLLDLNMGSLNIYLSSVSNKMNDVMRLMTVISTIGMFLTVLVGWYGMNFREMPEIYWSYGYAIPAAFASAITTVAILMFRRKGWL